MKDEIKEILDKPKILMLSYGNYISLDDYVKLKDYITNLQEENERLNKDLDTSIEICNNRQKEIVRLNNIIDELEKWIKEDEEYAMNNFECGRCFNMFDILNKLKELKEGK